MGKRDLPALKATARPGLKSGISPQALQRWQPDLKAMDGEDDGVATISILDRIGGYDGTTARRIGGALRSIGGADVVVHINSPGGDFFEGLAIYNQLRDYEGQVTVRVLGMAASAASIIAMGADRVEVGRAAWLMIHNTWVMAAGDRHVMRDVADWLEPFDAVAAELYAARSGLDQADIAAMLDKETWISGSKAVDQGFADALLASDQVENAARASLGGLGEISPEGAVRKIEAALSDIMSRAERRALLAAVKKSGTPDAAPGTPCAAIPELGAALDAALAKLNTGQKG